MCASSRFPEAIILANILAKMVVKSLIRWVTKGNPNGPGIKFYVKAVSASCQAIDYYFYKSKFLPPAVTGSSGKVSLHPKEYDVDLLLRSPERVEWGYPIPNVRSPQIGARIPGIQHIWTYIWMLGAQPLAIDKGNVVIGWSKQRTFSALYRVI